MMNFLEVQSVHADPRRRKAPRLPRRHRFQVTAVKVGFEPLGRQLPIWIKEAKNS